LVSAWWDATVDADALSEQQRLAHEIVIRRRDLTPSVERIMDTDLDDSVRSRALAAFSAALSSPGDPNRDPRIAIINAKRRPSPPPNEGRTD
jgi:hypothetical protein